MISAVVLTLVWAADGAVVPLVLMLSGSALLVAALDAAGVGPGACTFEALAAGSLGALLGGMLAVPAVAVGVPLFVAAVDTWGGLARARSRPINRAPRRAPGAAVRPASLGGAARGPPGR